MYCYFLSYKLLPLSDAIALGLSGPIFLTILSVPLLGEKVGWRRWSAVIVGFLGVMIMTRPGFGRVRPGGPGAASRRGLLRARHDFDPQDVGDRTAHHDRLLLHRSLPWWPRSSPCRSACSIPILPGSMPHTAGEFGICWSSSARWAGRRRSPSPPLSAAPPVSVVAPFDYMALVYGFLLGFLLFGELPDHYLIIGGHGGALSGIYIIHRETLLAREQRRQATMPSLPIIE